MKKQVNRDIADSIEAQREEQRRKKQMVDEFARRDAERAEKRFAAHYATGTGDSE